MENIDSFSVFYALDYLKQGHKIISYISGIKTYFKYKNNNIICFNDKVFYSLNDDDFLDIFKNNEFIIYGDEENNLDELDKQYYEQLMKKK